MVKIKNPLMSLKASGSLSQVISFVRRRGVSLAEKKPVLKDARSEPQLGWRHMFTKCVDLWHTLSVAEKQEWESAARPRHMTGYAWYISQCLRPNPGIYLPLQGGTMQGIIDMDGYAIQDLLDPAAAQDADTKAARDAAIAAAIGGSLTCDVYGYDGTIWQKLLVESAAQHNLRVRLYSGGTPLNAGFLGRTTISPTGVFGLDVRAGLYTYLNATTLSALAASSVTGDNSTGTNMLQVDIRAWNGARFDRLRSYPTGILQIGRAGIGLLDTRMTGTGQVGAAVARKLYWVSMNPSAANSLVELTDAAAGGAAVKWDMFHSSRMGHMVTFDPPLEFLTGIYVETWTAMTSAIFGYL